MPGPAGAREGLAVSPGSQSCPRANPPSGVTQWGSSPLQERAGPEALESRYTVSQLRHTIFLSFPGDGVDFLSWFLNALHSALGGTKKKKKSKSCYFVKGRPFLFCCFF